MTWQRILVDGRLQRRFVPGLEQKLPAFVFDQQRATCEACARSYPISSSAGDKELRCNLHGGRRIGCSSLRLAGEPCGPEAKHFTPRED